MWTKVENETIYPQDLTLLKYFKIRKFIKVFSILYFPTYFFLTECWYCWQQATAGSDWTRVSWQLWGWHKDHEWWIWCIQAVTSQQDITRLKLWGIAFRGYAWRRGTRVCKKQVYYFECVEKSSGGCLFSSLKGHSGFLFYMIYLELYNIAIADKHSSQLRLK